MSAELLVETLQEIVPAYPFSGVTVTEDVPEPPAAMARLVAETVNDSLELEEEPTFTVKLPEDDE